MLDNSEDFSPFIDIDEETFEQYIDWMRKDKEWGGNLEIQAMSLRY